MSAVEFMPATRADVDAIGGVGVPYRFRGETARIDGRVIAIGGIAMLPDGAHYAFAHLTDEMKAHRFALHRRVLKGIDGARKAGVRRIVATAETSGEVGERWLMRLGFERRETDGHKVFIWQAD